MKALKKDINLRYQSATSMLFDLKRADLLAQSPEFHNQLLDINNQEEKVKIYK